MGAIALNQTLNEHHEIGTTDNFRIRIKPRGLRLQKHEAAGHSSPSWRARSGNEGNIGSGGKLTSGTPADGSEKPFEGLAAGPGHPGWTQNHEALQADTVHFDYDKSTIRADEKPKVAAVADYLKANPTVAVLIEGHCDERGTEEYNRSLGERRALALREELARLGVDPNRVDTLTFGRDRPVDTGHSEASHAKNRRGEFVVLTAPK